jgi:hypothetical protein
MFSPFRQKKALPINDGGDAVSNSSPQLAGHRHQKSIDAGDRQNNVKRKRISNLAHIPGA